MEHKSLKDIFMKFEFEMFYLDWTNQVLWLEKVLLAIEAEVIADALAKKS